MLLDPRIPRITKAEGPANPERRKAVQRCACACAGAAGAQAVLLQPAFAAEPADQRPTRGDRLVSALAEGPPKTVTAADVKINEKPLLVFPYDAEAKVVRDGSRFNKLLLVRMDPASLDETTRARSVDGVLAFSAICTHEGCDVTEWVDDAKQLLCFCHFSRFDPMQSGKVTAGPAATRLPWLPLKQSGGDLIVDGALSAPPGKRRKS